MARTRLSIKTDLTVTIFLMGLLVVVFTILTGEVYRELIFNNQQKAFSRLAEFKVHDLLEKTKKDAIQLSLTIQSETAFQKSFRNNNNLTDVLNENFHRGLVTLGILELKKIQVLDKKFRLVASSTEGNPHLSLEKDCPEIRSFLVNRKGATRIKPLSMLCIHNNAPRLITIESIGGIRLKGYLLLATNPLPVLSNVSNELVTPLQIKLNDIVVFQSNTWPLYLDKKKHPLSIYKQHINNGNVLSFEFSPNIDSLINELSFTRSLLLLAALFVTLIAIALSLLKLRRSTLSPLLRLTEHLHNVIKDKKHLETPVTPSGNTEIHQLTVDFNSMSNELYSLYNRLEDMAYTDSLTKMNNRALLYEKLQQATSIAINGGTCFALLMMDLNRFKYINDTLGHHAGDLILQKVGERLQSSLRDDDIAARLGGDEFAVMLSTVYDNPTAKMMATKITEALCKPIHIENHKLSIEISIGIVLCPKHGTDIHNLMKYADIAMYHCKRHNIKHALYDDSMNSETLYEFTMEPKLREAIDKEQLKLYYQPKIDITTNTITGVEALVRWTHPELGIITPDKFIPLAERTGLIHPLTEWVLQTAYIQALKWHLSGYLLGISVNLSSLSLNENYIINMLDRLIEVDSHIKPDWLTLELTESTIMSDTEHSLEILTKLDGMNIQLSVDDFGTGYSSLAYLKRLPVDEIKIDKSFILSMLDDNNDAIIVKSTIDLAHNMGLTVVAEGIENEETWNKLQDMGCDLGQGFYMCRPCPAKDLNLWFSRTNYKIKNALTLEDVSFAQD